jgi:hypothetical protein
MAKARAAVSALRAHFLQKVKVSFESELRI